MPNPASRLDRGAEWGEEREELTASVKSINARQRVYRSDAGRCVLADLSEAEDTETD